MKTLTAMQFSELTFECIHCEIVNQDDDQYTDINDGTERFSRTVWGNAVMQSNEDKAITVTLEWCANTMHANSYKDSFDFDIGFNNSADPVFAINGAKLVDEDGDDLHNEQFEIEQAMNGCEWESCARNLCPVAENAETICEDVPMDDDNLNPNYITIERDNDRDLTFVGEELAQVSSADPYGNNGGRWTVLKLFKTRGGKYVCQSIGRTQWQGERDRYAAEVCDTEAQVIAFFGQGRLAKEIYADVGIVNVQHVD